LHLRGALHIFPDIGNGKDVRLAIVHEWFTGMRGGEKCVEALCEVFPDATLFTLVHVPGSVSPIIERMPIVPSFVQRLPFAGTRYRYYLPLFPAAIQALDLRGFDVVISSNHCVAKGVTVPPGALHICYCHTPMRYIWDLYDEYFRRGRAGIVTRVGMRIARPFLRAWDVKTAAHPHRFIANSENIRQKIHRLYGRSADVIYPPVDTARFRLSRAEGDYFLIVSAFVPYKRIDLAIEAFNEMGERLLIVGDGPDDVRLRRMAGHSIKFLGWQSDDHIAALYAGCRAVIFPGEEDFGIVPVEAMATGKPVIAYGRGGALETVRDSDENRTGILFREQSSSALKEAVQRFTRTAFDPEKLRTWALGFDREEYKRLMRAYVERRVAEFPWGPASIPYGKRS
jgi:glycosyltransferase involved in cell wall biosynthesis